MALSKTKLTVLAIAVFLLPMLSCGRSYNTLKDGYYTAVAAVFDDYGWKEYVTICVSGGRIILAEYDAYNSSGFIKSWDMDYMRVMEAQDGTYPNAYTRYYSSNLIERQSTSGIDALSGASHSFPSFISLADTVLKNAAEGNNKTTIVMFGELLGEMH